MEKGSAFKLAFFYEFEKRFEVVNVAVDAAGADEADEVQIG
jgi:hypothetical protein